VAAKCEKNHILQAYFCVFAADKRGVVETPANPRGRHVMKTRFTGSCAGGGHVPRAFTFGLLLALAASGPARADLATPEQRRACTPDVYRLCAGEIPNVRAITACLRRQKSSLSEACRAVFDQ
jgi:hypothetical protein